MYLFLFRGENEIPRPQLQKKLYLTIELREQMMALKLM